MEEEVGRQHLEVDRPGVRQDPEDSGKRSTMEETSVVVICSAPATLAVKIDEGEYMEGTNSSQICV